jgi:hypothetical protein
MASYRGHLMLAAPLGAAYGSLTLLHPEWDWGPIFLGAGFCAIGGVLPDLDSDSGVPQRELFGTMSAVAAALLYWPLRHRHGLPVEQTLVFVGLFYFLLRYVVAALFRRLTVHRGMFHSIPAMVIAGLTIYLVYPTEDLMLRFYLSGAVMLGFLSHLVLDEFCAVDFNGMRVKFNKFAGSAVKFGSHSWIATLTTYTLLVGLGYLAWEGAPDWARLPHKWPIPTWLGGQARAQQGQ